jgi:hypothetical protein
MNHYQAIILALDDLGGEGTIKEVSVDSTNVS